jgi:hypothetical protein
MEGDTRHGAHIYFIYNIHIYSRRLERYSVVLHIKYMSGYIMHQLQFYSYWALTASNGQKGRDTMQRGALNCSGVRFCTVQKIRFLYSQK